jgi:hypothetical protein
MIGWRRHPHEPMLTLSDNAVAATGPGGPTSKWTRVDRSGVSREVGPGMRACFGTLGHTSLLPVSVRRNPDRAHHRDFNGCLDGRFWNRSSTSGVSTRPGPDGLVCVGRHPRADRGLSGPPFATCILSRLWRANQRLASRLLVVSRRRDVDLRGDPGDPRQDVSRRWLRPSTGSHADPDPDGVNRRSTTGHATGSCEVRP